MVVAVDKCLLIGGGRCGQVVAVDKWSLFGDGR